MVKNLIMRGRESALHSRGSNMMYSCQNNDAEKQGKAHCRPQTDRVCSQLPNFHEFYPELKTAWGGLDSEGG